MSELYHFHVQFIFHFGPGLADTLYSEAPALRTLITESKSQTKMLFLQIRIRICTLVQSICRPAESLQKNIWQSRQWYSVSQDHVTIWELISTAALAQCALVSTNVFQNSISKSYDIQLWFVWPILNGFGHISGYQVVISIQTRSWGGSN